MTEQLKYCLSIIKDLLNKKNAVRSAKKIVEFLHFVSLQVVRLAVY